MPQWPLRTLVGRAGLTIWQTGELPGASRLNIKTLLFLVFHVYRLFTKCQNCRAFWWLRFVCKLRKLPTLAFIDFRWLKRIEPNGITLYGFSFSDFK